MDICTSDFVNLEDICPTASLAAMGDIIHQTDKVSLETESLGIIGVERLRTLLIDH